MLKIFIHLNTSLFLHENVRTKLKSLDIFIYIVLEKCFYSILMHILSIFLIQTFDQPIRFCSYLPECLPACIFTYLCLVSSYPSDIFAWYNQGMKIGRYRGLVQGLPTPKKRHHLTNLESSQITSRVYFLWQPLYFSGISGPSSKSAKRCQNK